MIHSLQVGLRSPELLLIRLTAGSDDKACDEIKKQLSNAGCSYMFYKVLGPWDLLVLLKNHTEPMPLHLNSVPGVLAIDRISCFEWVEESNRKTALDFRSKPNFVAVTMLKLMPNLVATYGISFERIIASAIVEQAKKHSVKCAILGGLGWYEIIMVVFANEMTDIMDFVEEITQVQVGFEDVHREVKFEQLTLKSYTTIGINRTLIEQGRLKSQLKESIGEKGELQVELRVSRYPAFDKVVKRELKKYIGVSNSLFGKYDLLVRVEGKSVGEYIEGLLKFRASTASQIITTWTEVTHIRNNNESQDHNKQESVSSIKALKIKELSIPEDALKLAESISSDLESELSNLFASYNSYLNDPLSADCVVDLKPFIKWFGDNLSDFITKEKPADNIRKGIYLIDYGVKQRLRGTYRQMLDPAESIGLQRVGIHKALMAASVLPSHTLSKAGCYWNGFIIFGATNAYRGDIGGIFNLGEEILYRPEQWWGLFHEIGHEYWYQKGHVFDINSELRDFVYYTYGEIPKSDILQITLFAWEALADIFDFVVGFNRDFKQYLKTIWSYLEPRIGITGTSTVQYYFSRSLCVYLFETFVVKTEEIPQISDLNIAIKAVVRELEEILEPTSIASVKKITEEAIAFVKNVWVWIISVAKIELENDELLYLRIEKMDETKYFDEIRRGIIIESLDDPVAFIRSLNKAQYSMNFRSRIAALLTLYNFAMSQKSSKGTKEKT